MDHSASVEGTRPISAEKRRPEFEMPPLILVGLDPLHVVDGVPQEEGIYTEDIRTFGRMRETCPECEGVPLQLVLRQKRVRVEHLLCPQCTRCFSAFFSDGTSALSIAD
jgi:hypothetical protein